MEAPPLDDEFYMYRCKIQMCPRQDPHPHKSCPYLHPNESAGRRDPQMYTYDSIFCYDLRNAGTCRRGAACPYSHGVYEYFLHPRRYRTRMCEYGSNCTRELCFFAHNESELRPGARIRQYSGGRRSGRAHRAAAAALPAAPVVGSPADGSSSPQVFIMQAPELPSSADGSGPDTATAHMLAHVSLPWPVGDTLQQQQQQQLVNTSQSLVSTPDTQLLPQQQQQPVVPVLILQAAVSGPDPAGLVWPSGTGVVPQMEVVAGSAASTQAMLPVSSFELSQASLPASSTQPGLQPSTAPGLMAGYVFAISSELSPALVASQQQQHGAGHYMSLDGFTAPNVQCGVQAAGSTYHYLDASGQQYTLVPVAVGSGGSAAVQFVQQPGLLGVRDHQQQLPGVFVVPQ